MHRDVHTVCSSYWLFGGARPTRFVLVIPRAGCATPMFLAGEYLQGRFGLYAYRVSHISEILAILNISSTNTGSWRRILHRLNGNANELWDA
jgi:hypothetical protein